MYKDHVRKLIIYVNTHFKTFYVRNSEKMIDYIKTYFQMLCKINRP